MRKIDMKKGGKAKAAQLAALLEWAKELGFDAKGEAVDVQDSADALARFAMLRGAKIESFEDVIQWAQGCGFRESDSLDETLAAFREAARTIALDAATSAPVADEGAIAGLRAGSTSLLPLADLDSWIAALTSADAERRLDAARVIARVAAPVPLGAMPANVVHSVSAILKLVATEKLESPSAKLREAVARAERELRVPGASLLRIALRENDRALFDELWVVGQFHTLAPRMTLLLEAEVAKARSALAAVPSPPRRHERDIKIPAFQASIIDLTPNRAATGHLELRPTSTRMLDTKEQLRLHLRDVEARLERVRSEHERASKHLANLLQTHRTRLVALAKYASLLDGSDDVTLTRG